MKSGRYITAWLILLSSFAGALAHVKTPIGVELAPALRGGHEHLDTAKQAANTEAALIEHSRAERPWTKNNSQCGLILGLLLFFCCCGGCLKIIVGDQAAVGISVACSIGMFAYLVHDGTYAAAFSGKGVGWQCMLVCIWCLIQMTCLSCLLGCLCIFVGAAIAIKNVMIKEMRKEYEVKVKHLSGPRQEYYESELFKGKCDALFEKADQDKSGTLDMSELQEIVVEVIGEEGLAVAPLLQQAFDDNGSSKVEKDEFAEMMKFISVSTWQEGKFTEEMAFEVLQLPETATKADVTKAHRKMALKWHPDKRHGVPSDIAAKDMAEINDAKAKLEEKFDGKGDANANENERACGEAPAKFGNKK